MAAKTPATGPIPGYQEFELDIERVLREQLPTFFDTLKAAPLTQSNVQAIPPKAKGAYLLLHKGIPVYAGKTDARHGFRSRLERHWFTIQHRIGLDLKDVEFKAVRVMVFSNFDVEAILIKRMRATVPGSLEWNDSGFGSNDPGHNREGQAPAEIDERWPIDIDKELENVGPSGPRDLLPLLVQLKGSLPYTFRYETELLGKKKNGKPHYAKHTAGHPDHRSRSIDIPTGPVTVRLLLRLVVDALPSSQWQATVFPNRVILYKENVGYPYAREIIR